MTLPQEIDSYEPAVFDHPILFSLAVVNSHKLEFLIVYFFKKNDTACLCIKLMYSTIKSLIESLPVITVY
jgi:hypothetical protein